MPIKRRWIDAVIATAKSQETTPPWTRARRARRVARNGKPVIRSTLSPKPH